MSNIIGRNTSIPIEKTKEYTTSNDNQTEVKIQVFEGEDNVAKNNSPLGTFTLGGIAPRPAGVA